MLIADAQPNVDEDVRQVARHYHQRTKHRFERYAAGPETLDWDAQPAPFRHFEDTVKIALPAIHDLKRNPALMSAFNQPFEHLDAAIILPCNLATLGALLQLSFGITAWKTLGPDRWAVRANPSSGNLHPIEVYALVHGISEIPDGIYHYCAESHSLEHRADITVAANALPFLQIGLSSIMWREAWKYGERAFRYCQLDTGHAMGALSYAAAVLGWSVYEDKQYSSQSLNQLMGLDRKNDFPYKRFSETEQEEAEVLLSIRFSEAPAVKPKSTNRIATTHWHGVASRIDAHPMYRWPAVQEAAEATRYQPRPDLPFPHLATPPTKHAESKNSLNSAANIILGRRSAQRFDARHTMPKQVFIQMIEALLPVARFPWNTLASHPLINLILFIHRVEGITPGLYLLLRAPRLAAQLSQSLNSQFLCQPVLEIPEHIPLQLLTPAPSTALYRTARSLHCHQDIAANACFAVGMLAEYNAAISHDASSYRDMHREAGLIGQVLYLQAESHGLRGTGIGCFFDEPVHQLLGLADDTFQTIYHFTVGLPLEDSRISTTFTFEPTTI